ncbi:MAG: TonB-dependent receptor [Acidobacteria bacterium]|nr:TonB-dependent receptor [Acidobacteriota bacterium]
MRLRTGSRLLIIGLLAILAAGVARAQTTTGTLRGNVSDETGGYLPGATVTASNEETGFSRSATTAASGFYNISLVPGPYTVVVTLPSFATVTSKVQIRVGDTTSLDVRLNLEARARESVTVTAEAPVIETKSNEIATNVSEEQIKNLPQGSRNFLNFAALAPGVRISDSADNKQVTAAGAEGFNTNVFIDGTSYKNDVLLGGVVGQDSSKGNPFPQNAVQEFRVMTQNFKAEYEKAGTAVITAVTKSGTNTYSGDVFAYYQNKNLVARSPFIGPRRSCNSAGVCTGTADPDYTRWQGGVDLGGPILNDRVHFYGSYELNNQNRANTVILGGQPLPPAIATRLNTFTGTFTSPFRENLAFGKLSWQASQTDLLDVSGFYRHETDVKDYGGQTSFQSANNIVQNVYNGQAKYTRSGASYLSETTLSYNSYQWHPTPTNGDVARENYFGALLIGGGNNNQNFHQKRFTVREDFSYLGFHLGGDHVIKSGVYANFAKYDVQKFQDTPPTFNFRSDEKFAFPFEAHYGVGNPDLSAKNNEYGVYLQDDWTPTSRLTVNVGLRWDYETDMLNNNYVTPAAVRQNLSGLIPAEFFTDGSQRPAYKNMWQPRLGVSFDVTGKGTTVVYAGYGRYFDRDVYNFVLDERFRLQYADRTFRFSADGAPRDGFMTIRWDPSYLSQAGLDRLIANGTAPNPEVFLINNNTKPPRTDQFSVGVRQAFGPVATSVSYAAMRGDNGFTFNFARDANEKRIITPAYQNILISEASKKFWYNAVYATIDKPYTVASRWGLGLAYTYGKSDQTGNDLFSLDFPHANSPRHPTPNDERHRIVFSGIVGLPFDVRASTLITLGTGLPYTILDASLGFDRPQFKLRLNEGRQPGTFPYQSWDLRLQKDFPVGRARIGLVAEGFNLTNHNNFGCYEGFISKLPEVNPNFGKPSCLVTDGRRAQFGVNVGF